MIRQFSIYCFFILAISFSSCKDSKRQENDASFKQIRVGDSYVLSIPNYMEKATGLNNEALVQFQNTEREVYMIVIPDEKEALAPMLKPSNEKYADRTLVSLYGEMQMRALEERVKIRRKGRPNAKIINGMQSEIVEFDAKVPGVDKPIFYHLALIEGKDDFIMLMSWTLLENRSLYKETFTRITNSFELVK